MLCLARPAVGDPSSGLLGFFAPPAPRGEAPRLVTVIALHNHETHVHSAKQLGTVVSTVP